MQQALFAVLMVFMVCSFGLGILLGWAMRHTEVGDLKAQIGRFDHDGDGRPGGSRKRR